MVVVHELPMPLLVELVNGWGSVPRKRADGRPRASVAEFLRGHELPAELAELAELVDDDELERVADLLYPVFDDPAPGRRSRALVSLLTASQVRPTLTVDGEGELHAAWEVSDPRQALLAAAAVTLRSELAARDLGRFGTCASTSCGDVYVDASPGARRRFCSVTCQNRERVAAFRRRRATGTG